MDIYFYTVYFSKFLIFLRQLDFYSFMNELLKIMERQGFEPWKGLYP